MRRFKWMHWQPELPGGPCLTPHDPFQRPHHDWAAASGGGSVFARTASGQAGRIQILRCAARAHWGPLRRRLRAGGHRDSLGGVGGTRLACPARDLPVGPSVRMGSGWGRDAPPPASPCSLVGPTPIGNV
jgi:hypothetical protein